MSDNTTEPTIQDVLDRLDAMETRLDQRIDAIYRRLTGIENRLASLEQTTIKLVAASAVPV